MFIMNKLKAIMKYSTEDSLENWNNNEQTIRTHTDLPVILWSVCECISREVVNCAVPRPEWECAYVQYPCKIKFI